MSELSNLLLSFLSRDSMDLECYRIKVSEFHLYRRFLKCRTGQSFLCCSQGETTKGSEVVAKVGSNGGMGIGIEAGSEHLFMED